MFLDDSLAGSWTALVDRVDGGRLTAWGDHEPALRGLCRVADLTAALAPGSDPGRWDEILGALVRLAAIDGPGDDDALLVLLHLLSPMVRSLGVELVDLTPDITAVLVGELACQIRGYPWRRRTRAWAANLRAETRRAVLAEYRPWLRRAPECGELAVDPASARWAEVLTGTVPDPAQHDDLDVVDLLVWATRNGVPSEDIALLVATEQARSVGQRDADHLVAHRHGVAMRTFYRRRAQTLAALRSSARDYLAAVA